MRSYCFPILSGWKTVARPRETTGVGVWHAYMATCLRRERNTAHRGHLMAFVSAATRLESSVGGWVCRACNTGVGMVDDIEHLEKRIAFLKAHEKKVERIALIKAVHEEQKAKM